MVRFWHHLLAMDSLLLTGIELWGFAGQLADLDAPAKRAPFALLIVLTQPASHARLWSHKVLFQINSEAVMPGAPRRWEHQARKSMVTARLGRPVTGQSHIWSALRRPIAHQQPIGGK
jgi:hypothetical protein